MKVNVCFDLGSDTLKVVYSYEKGKVQFGKIVKNTFDDTAFPATAFYDEEKGKWLFANDIDDSGVESYTTVIKIKKLLSLLVELGKDSKEIEERNKFYYFHGNKFPKFYFPNRIKLNNENDFQEKVVKDMTFECLNKTPKDICEDYFRYIKGCVFKQITKIVTDLGGNRCDVEYGVIYPPRVGHAYINEIKRLITAVFGKLTLAISSTKAISMYAYHLNVFKENEPILIFDMGEEKIQVAKAQLVKQGDFNGVAVDSSEGHSDPGEVGGDDIDRAIVDYLENTVEKRETMGSPSYGSFGHIIERGVHSKQYLLMKSVKQAKAILSDPKSKTNIFRDGVPVTMYREIMIQNSLTEEELLKCIGISESNTTYQTVADKIVEYIVDETKLAINKDTNKILLSGGLIETIGLYDYICSEISRQIKRKIEVVTLETNDTSDSEYKIQSFEDSVYSAALGGVMVMQMGYQIKMIATRSFAINVVARTLNVRCLGIFIDRGRLFNEGEFIGSGYFSKGSQINIEIYTIDTSYGEIVQKIETLYNEYRKYNPKIYYREYDRNTQDYRGYTYPLRKGYIIQKQGEEYYYFENYREGPNGALTNEYRMLLGNPDSSDMYRQAVKRSKNLKFKVLSGGAGSNLTFYYRNRRVSFVEFLTADESTGALQYKIGVRFDEEGRGVPEAFNDVEANGFNRVVIKYENTGYTETVYCKDIEPRMPVLDAIDIGDDG